VGFAVDVSGEKQFESPSDQSLRRSGVDTDVISSITMIAKNQPGHYFVGEVLDLSGHLGSINFQ
jgi:predicted flavoprotein YhiN